MTDCILVSVEPEPVGWQFYQDGKWWNGDDRIKDHKKNTREAGFRIRDVYAATQPAEQREPYHECGGDGAGGEHEDDCSQQPAPDVAPTGWKLMDVINCYEDNYFIEKELRVGFSFGLIFDNMKTLCEYGHELHFPAEWVRLVEEWKTT